MALASTSSQTNHDVFLSFRGEDTRKNFTGHLYTALTQAGIQTFIDSDALQRGNEIPLELRRAIRETKISIIVFSENYASSRWCLDELVEILVCKRNLQHLVLPVFYHVNPSIHVRRQKGSYEEAFRSHEQRFTAEKVKKWRNALIEAGNISGYDLENDTNGHEPRLIQNIVTDILLKLDPRSLNVPDNLVGMDSRVNHISSLLKLESRDVRLVGIYGMGGIGKTTIAKVAFNKYFHYFESSFFASNVRENSKKSGGLLHLQEKLLSALLNRDVKVDHFDKGVSLMKERCRSKKVLIVLDDLNELIQVRLLAGQRHSLGPGSRIIITTRDVHVLDQAQVYDRYEVKELDYNESLELFSWHAFRKPIPSEDYMVLSKGIVKYARGLPLVLEVIGSYLVNRTTMEWKNALEKLSRIPNNEIQEQLRISFDALGDNTVKDIFLDIACFFIGMKKVNVTMFWNACGFFGEDGVSNLKSKCLLKIDERSRLRMHDHLRDMGREIIRKESPKRPENRSRLWLQEDVLDVLTNHKGTESTEGIMLDLCSLEPIYLDANAFEVMRNLRLLQINNVHLTGRSGHLFKELRWLTWHYCPLECLPLDFHPPKLMMLDMRHSKINILWQGVKYLENLKILDLSFCKFLTETPDFSSVKGLERLMIRYCTCLFEVHPSIGFLVKLRYLDLRNCKSLRSLPSSICNLRSLEELYLDYCLNLETLPENLGKLGSLSTLSASDTGFKQLPHSIGHLGRLKHLNLSFCENLQKLPSTICNLNSLEELYLHNCLNLEILPCNFGNMECLRRLNIGHTSITELPDSIGLLSRRIDLDMRDCMNLINLPRSICNLKLMGKLELRGCSNLEKLPEQLGDMESLRTLDLAYTSITKLPDSIGLLKMLVFLYLTNCTNLVELPTSICDVRSLQYLDICGCSNLDRLPEQLGNMACLSILSAKGTVFKHLPDSIGYLKNLTELSLEGHHRNSDSPFSVHKGLVPSSIFHLHCLRELRLRNCGLCQLRLNEELFVLTADIPDDIGSCLSSLEVLDLSGNNFCSLPASLGQLTNLHLLDLRDCRSLVSFPELPPNLESFDARECKSLEELPNLSNLEYLESLNLSNCIKLADVQGLEYLYSLRSVCTKGCRKLKYTLSRRLVQRQFQRGTPSSPPQKRKIPDWVIYNLFIGG